MPLPSAPDPPRYFADTILRPLAARLPTTQLLLFRKASLGGQPRVGPATFFQEGAKTQMTTAEPRTIDDRFTLQKRIGDGRMSSVYVALDTASDNTVAIKILDTRHSDALKEKLFKRDTTALKRLRHPAIVRLQHSGWSASERAFYLVLDYLPYSLGQYLEGAYGETALRIQPYRIMRELVDALAHAHSENVVHRDIKPSNILLTEDGRPVLTDFGISKILTDLTVGETLANFWSGGYASPEQRAGKPASRRSDVYSLGAVFYHLLSQRQPPSEGPTPVMVDDHVNQPRPVKNLLRAMLDANPDARPASGATLLSRIDVTRRHDDLPQHFLVLTSRAVGDLSSGGHCAGNDFQDAVDALIDDLGGLEANEIHVSRDQHDERGLILLGDSLRLVCTRNVEDTALLVKTIQAPYGPHMERQKSRSMSYRAVWLIRDHGENTEKPPKGMARTLRQLWMSLSRFERVDAASKRQRRSRQEIIEHWDAALRESRQRIEQRTRTLKYASVVEEPDYFRFSLSETPPDDLGWGDDTRLAIRESEQTRMVPVGNLLGIRGKVVSVAKPGNENVSFREDRAALPSTGLLMMNVTEALADNTRQRYAVNAFLNGQMVNPNIANCIVDPANATRLLPPALAYFQNWLSEDKKYATKMALAAGELFLIKGPPGTGKTSVIAEIVLQILKRRPEARILLTSQSNVAVDHALSQIARAAPKSPPAMVRYGRPEKISEAGRNWTVGRRVRSWRKKVVGRCDAIIDELRQAERVARTSAKMAEEVDAAEEDDAEMMQEWVTEARVLLDRLQDYEQELRALTTDVSDHMKATVEAAVETTRNELRDQLTALDGLLPEGGRTNLEGETETEALARIVRAVAKATAGEEPAGRSETKAEHRSRDVRTILTQWRRVAGLGSDFTELVAKSARVVAATCSMSGKPKVPAPENSFDWAIVDEAGRATVPEVLIPIVQAERAILVGDERQLPPMVDEAVKESEPEALEEGLDRSLFQTMVEQMQDTEGLVTLRTQYRMHPAIGNLISAVFYDGLLKNGAPVDGRRALNGLMPAAVTWLSTSALRNRAETRRDESYENVVEADVVWRVLRKMENHVQEGSPKAAVGVITGYSAQVERLVTRLEPDSSDTWRRLDIEIATVDAFQGRECDVVVYSTVRSNRVHRIGFLRDYRRVNVALSRARDMVIIVGDDAMMRTASVGGGANPFAEVLNYMHSRPGECAVVPAGLARL